MVIICTSLSMFYSHWILCFILSQRPLCWIQFSAPYRKGIWGWNLLLVITCSDLSVRIVTLLIYNFFFLRAWESLGTLLLSVKVGLGISDAIYFVVIFKWPFQIHPINEINFNLFCITDWSEELNFLPWRWKMYWIVFAESFNQIWVGLPSFRTGRKNFQMSLTFTFLWLSFSGSSWKLLM